MWHFKQTKGLAWQWQQQKIIRIANLFELIYNARVETVYHNYYINIPHKLRSLNLISMILDLVTVFHFWVEHPRKEWRGL